jgi:TPM domain
VNLFRLLKHLCTPDWVARRPFTPDVLRKIEQAIKASERQHDGELRFAVEGPLPLRSLVHSQRPRARAEELFSELRVWDTAHNSGVLVYVQLIDRQIEIVADRSIAAKVGQAEWNAICRAMEKSFREGRFAEGAQEAIERITALLAQHFPARGANPNELPDKPLVL